MGLFCSFYQCSITKLAKGRMNTIASPVDTPGQWVLPDCFNGLKSIGYFACPRSNGCTSWVSAHAYAGFAQGCRHCGHYSPPLLFWRHATGANVTSVRGPRHHSHTLCERCHVEGCFATTVMGDRGQQLTCPCTGQ